MHSGSLLLLTGLAVLPLVATGALPPPDRPYNILMLLPACSISHRNVFMPLATELTKRGHKITMITPFDAPDSNPNTTYIKHGINFDPQNNDMFQIRDDVSELMKLFIRDLPELARDLYNVPSVREVYENRNKFDLSIIDWSFNEIAYPFVHDQNFIMIATAGIDSLRSAVQGNVINPAYFSSSVKDFKLPMTLWDRVTNIFLQIQLPTMWYNLVLPSVQAEIDKHFPGLPRLLEIERTNSLTLYNSHHSMDISLPLLPTQVEIGGIHCRPGQPLPKNIDDFLSGEVPVIYFSTGTVVTGKSMPSHYQDILVSTFAKLPYKILWKFETERKDIPKNVMIQKWMPQQDILAHPNVKLFISHCGLLSIQEAMYHATPILGLPVFADQPRNAEKMQNGGMGRTLRWEDLSEKLFTSEITEIMTNPKYRDTIAPVAKHFRDQLQSPLDRAVFWTEYVIRHDGARHLRSPELDLTWTQLLHLDLLLLLHLGLYICYKIVRTLVGMCCGSSKANKKKKKE